MNVQPYLMFDGKAEAAIAFYRRALGAEVAMLMRFTDNPDSVPPGLMPPGSENKVMHAELRIGASAVMVSDGHCAGKPSFAGFALSIAAADASEAKRVFDALAEGGTVTMPLGKTFWSPSFGMLTDRFGVGWMVNALAP